MKACMDSSSDWLKSIVSEERGMDDSSPSVELITCYSSPPVPERRLRPPHDQALKCPRCDSTHTKFCYYNNYSLSQPRYFCKACRRYWTKGGSLRNVPVGGGCRKNKRSGSKKPSEEAPIHHQQPIDLHLSYNPSFGSSASGLELVESKFGAMFGGSKTHLFMGGSGSDMGFHGLNPLGFPIDGNHGSLMEAWQRFDGQEDSSAMEVKPADRMLSLEWQEQGCVELRRDSFGCSTGLGLWAGMISGQGPLNG